jgi:hypothetical protein
MQANLGLFPGVGQPTMAGPIKSPAQIAAELSAQATANLQYASTIGPQVARNMPQLMAFGQQFQHQFSAAQSMQSFNPYMANMMGGAMGSPQMNLPSPIMMTPASMGVFRPPMQSANYAPIPPMYSMPLIQTPFTPQIPRPMFQTAWDQEMRQRDYRADAIYSYAMQAPRAGGNMAGYGIGAFAGAAMGGRMGSPLLGAAIGMIGAGVSGLSGGMGDLAMMPFRPQLEARQMGAGIQHMSQNFVVGGSQLHQSGMGLTRGASRQLATGIMDMVDSRSFQQQTGGMFSRGDMMQMLSTGGQAGLMDFAQNTDQIKEQLRKAAISVKKFMELTNDPDMNSLIRRMASMQNMGFSMNDMTAAAGNMRRYSRSAGTTIEGIMEAGGAGSMLYQGMGLSGASGMNFGMFSAMAAKQAVSAGVFSPAELALRGGVSGVAQRNMQAQAAMMSMPIVGASMSSFQNGSWGVNYGQMAGQMSGRGGATGFVMGAANNLARAAQSGGVGALALYGLQSRDMNDEISRSMSPEQQMAMRYQSALSLGQQFGLKGAGAFAVGATKMYGSEVASDMLKMASSPEFWKSLREGNHRQRDELARQQYKDIKDRTPGMWDDVRRTVGNMVGSGTGGGLGIGRSIGALTESWADTKRKEEARERGDYYVSESPYGGLSTSQVDAWASRKRVRGTKGMSITSSDPSGRSGADVWRDAAFLARGDNQGEMGWREKALRVVSPLANIPIAFASGGASVALAVAGADIDYGTAEKGMGWLMKQRLSPDEIRNQQKVAAAARKEAGAVYVDANKANTLASDEKSMDAKEALSQRLGINSTNFIMGLGHDVGRYAESKYTRVGFNGQVTSKDVRNLAIKKLMNAKPEFAAMVKTNPTGAWNAAQKFYDTLSTEDKSAITGGGVRFAKDVAANEKGANILATSEAEFNTGSGMGNLEDVQQKIRDTKESINFSLSAIQGGGLFGTDSQALQDSLLGTSAAQQVAMGIVYGGSAGTPTEKDRALLISTLQRENPKATAKQLQAMADKTLEEVALGTDSNGKTIISAEAKAQLRRAGEYNRSIGGTSETLGRQLIKVSERTDAAIETMGDALTSDFTGTSFGRDKLANITEVDIKAIERVNPRQAAAARRYLAAKKMDSSGEMEKAKASFEKEGVAGATGAAGKDISMLEATGSEADQLAGSMAAIDSVAASMERAFENFAPATKDFATGAKALAAFARQQAEKNAQVNPQTQGNTTDG